MPQISHGQELTKPWNLRVATYNIHGCVGTDGELDLPRVARVLNAGTPDVVALNEVYRYFSGSSQEQELAEAIGPGWTAVFGKTINKPLAQYGNGIITRLPVVSSESWLLDDYPGQERRGLLRVTVRKEARVVHVFCTHMGLNGVMRARAAKQVLDIMRDFDDDDCVLLGDFNETVPAGGLDIIREGGFTDAWAAFGLSAGKTFPSRPTLRRLDYIWLSESLAAESCYVATHADARVASDHLPVFASLLRSDEVENQETGGKPVEVDTSVPKDAVVLEDFQKVGGAEIPPWWRRVSARLRRDQESGGFGGVAIAGDQHFWRQKSSGEISYERKIDATKLDVGIPFLIGARVQMISPGDGWTLGMGEVELRVRHAAGELPILEILSGDNVVSSASLTHARIDPYSWNGYILELEPKPASLQVRVIVNGKEIVSAPNVGFLNSQNCCAISLKTDGGNAGTCEVFADDLVVWQEGDDVLKSDKDVTESRERMAHIFPPRIIRKSDSGEKVWWLDLW